MMSNLYFEIKREIKIKEKTVFLTNKGCRGAGEIDGCCITGFLQI